MLCVKIILSISGTVVAWRVFLQVLKISKVLSEDKQSYQSISNSRIALSSLLICQGKKT